MFRFYDFNLNQLPDFWLRYYSHKDLIKVMSYINTVLGAKVAGYKLLQGYDIGNIPEHQVGTVVNWEPLSMMSYRYNDHSPYPHSYIIPGNILSIQTLHEKYTNPEITLQDKIDFFTDEDLPGIMRLVKDVPTRDVLVTSGIKQGKLITSDNATYLSVELESFELLETYAYTYKVSNLDGVWSDVSVINPQFELEASSQWKENVDFTFDPDTRTLKTKVKLPIVQLFIAKGTVRGTRLNDDFGKIFGYQRYDSTLYRDRLSTMLPMFFDAPTIGNTKAVSNLAFNLPVAKYGDETVRAMRSYSSSEEILTNKYSYKMGGASLAYNVGDVIRHNEPLSDALTFYTERTHPGWWKDRLPDLFNKYAEDILTVSRKDQMLDSFLKYYLAHVRLDLSKVDTTSLAFVEDIWELLFDGLPVRSDIIVSTYLHLYDLDMEMPDFEKRVLRSRFRSRWVDCVGEDSPNWDFDIPTRTAVDHHILTEHAVLKDWTISGHRYKIVGRHEQQKQYWSTVAIQTPYVEPNWDNWYYNTVSTPTLPTTQAFANSSFSTMPLSVKKAFSAENSKIEAHRDHEEYDNIARVTGGFTNVEMYGQHIAGEYVYDYAAFTEWDYHGLWQGIEGIVCPFSNSGYAISPKYNMGYVPKDLRYYVKGDVPKGCTVKLAYSKGDSGVFIPVDIGETIYNVAGPVRLRIELSASYFQYPNIKEVYFIIRSINRMSYQDRWASSNI